MKTHWNKRKCRKCGQHIDPNSGPWVKVSPTGDESHYHKECGRD
jgi:hypothetical protein